MDEKSVENDYARNDFLNFFLLETIQNGLKRMLKQNESGTSTESGHSFPCTLWVKQGVENDYAATKFFDIFSAGNDSKCFKTYFKAKKFRTIFPTSKIFHILSFWSPSPKAERAAMSETKKVDF